MKKRTYQLVALILGLALIGGCASSGGETPAGAAPDLAPERSASEVPKPLRVGIARTAPPIIFARRGQTTGLEADLARELAKALGREIEFVPVFWPELIVELKTDHIDIIMAGMSITPERRREVAFAEPYMTIGQQVLIQSKDFHRWGDSRTIREQALRIGTEESSTGETLVRTEFPYARQKNYPRVNAAVEALVAGEIDAVVYDHPTARWMARRYRDRGIVTVPGLLTEEPLAWAVRKEDRRLLRAVNRVLTQWKQDGTLDELIRKWVPEAPGGS